MFGNLADNNVNLDNLPEDGSTPKGGDKATDVDLDNFFLAMEQQVNGAIYDTEPTVTPEDPLNVNLDPVSNATVFFRDFIGYHTYLTGEDGKVTITAPAITGKAGHWECTLNATKSGYIESCTSSIRIFRYMSEYGTPDFELLLIISSIVLALLLIRKRK